MHPIEKAALWVSCPIVGNPRSRMLTNGHFGRLCIRNLQKGLRPAQAAIASLILRISTQAIAKPAVKTYGDERRTRRRCAPGSGGKDC